MVAFPRFSKMSIADSDELDDTEDTWLQKNSSSLFLFHLGYTQLKQLFLVFLPYFSCLKLIKSVLIFQCVKRGKYNSNFRDNTCTFQKLL